VGTGFRDARHLIRLVVALVGALAAFVALRHAVVPDGFGVYGHYRAPAVEEAALQPAAFAGQNACSDCHSAVVETRNAGKHRGLACEGCHGPLAKHVEDPAFRPKLPDASARCIRCHEADAAKARAFPQVVSREHAAGEACSSCHKPHQPAI
jgi:hypothetical protein